MTTQQEGQITRMRLMGESCGQIAQCLDMPVNTVKSFCRRRNLSGKKKAEVQNSAAQCTYCGKEVRQMEHRKVKKFCSDACRMKWWSEHRSLIDRRTTVEFRCRNCGKVFTDYKSTERKYCSHECYIADRFGKTGHERGTVPQ